MYVDITMDLGTGSRDELDALTDHLMDAVNDSGVWMDMGIAGSRATFTFFIDRADAGDQLHRALGLLLGALSDKIGGVPADFGVHLTWADELDAWKPSHDLVSA